MAELPTVMSILTTLIGRAQRADSEAENPLLPKDQRTFHRGRSEAYLQMIALINGVEVKDVRPLVFGVRATAKAKAGKHRKDS